MFGAPNRITATTCYGDGEVIDIERGVDLGVVSTQKRHDSNGILVFSIW